MQNIRQHRQDCLLEKKIGLIAVSLRCHMDKLPQYFHDIETDSFLFLDPKKTNRPSLFLVCLPF